MTIVKCLNFMYRITINGGAVIIEFKSKVNHDMEKYKKIREEY